MNKIVCISNNNIGDNMRYICLECGNSSNLYGNNKECPICKNKNENTLLKYISFKEENREIFEHLLKRKTHSSAFIKMCGMDLINKGYKELGNALNEIAIKKLNIESMLLRAFGTSDDTRLNLAIIINRANEDVYLLKMLAEESNNKIYEELLKEEEQYYNELSLISKSVLIYM